MFTFYCDPGHGWLQVSAQDLTDLGLTASKFSAKGQFVQIRGDKVYLEEDCDAPQFLAAWKAKYGVVPAISEKYLNHRSEIGLR